MPLRYLAAVLSTVAALTLGIAAVGLFALVRYATQQRQREIGIRLALGATPAQVEWLLLRDALRDTRAGLIGGALITAALLSLMMPRLPMGSVVLLQACVMAALVLSAVLLVACWIPARNASRLNPNDVLRRG
jgi:ABC-type antimicrobial peptide transport system permease subunit